MTVSCGFSYYGSVMHKKLRSENGHNWNYGTLSLLFILQNICRLTFERLTYCFKGREADRFGFSIFQDRKVGHGDADFFGKFSDAHLALGEHDVDGGDDGHDGMLDG